MMLMFIYCYFGKLASEGYEQMPICLLYDLDWGKFPVKLQKYLVIMIANMQIPLYYHGFDILCVDLETFIDVRKLSKYIYICEFADDLVLSFLFDLSALKKGCHIFHDVQDHYNKLINTLSI